MRILTLEDTAFEMNELPDEVEFNWYNVRGDLMKFTNYVKDGKYNQENTAMDYSFDTIYHEHLDYHTLLPLKGLMDRSGFEVIEVSCINTHGGSIRVISQIKGAKYSVDSSVIKLIKDEEKLGLHKLSTYKTFSNRIDKTGKELKQTLLEIKLKGKKIAAYGAPAKATTLMYHFDIDSETIDFIVDDSKWLSLIHISEPTRPY